MATAAVKKKIRRDPAPATLSYDDDLGEVLNKDPNKHYVWVYLVGDQVGAYENRGFDIELVRPDGPRAAIQRKNKALDTPVEWKGNVLMSIDLSDYEEMVARGQRKVDQIEARIIDQDGVSDVSRGLARNRFGRPIVDLRNETQESETELG